MSSIPLQKQLPWASLLVVLYALSAYGGWDRTLLDDEIWALSYAGGPWSEHLQIIRSDLVHPPLIYLVERAVFAAFGFSDAAAKSIPLFLNLLLIPCFVLVAARTIEHWRVASLLLTLSLCHVGNVPTLVRMYALAALLALAAYWFYERWRSTQGVAALAAWSAVMAALAYTHYCGVALLGAFVAANVWSGPRRARFAVAAALSGSLFIPWLAFVAPVYQSRGLEANVAWTPPPVDGLAKTPYHFATALPPGHSAYGSPIWTPGPEYELALGLAALAAYAALFVAALWGARRRGGAAEPKSVTLFLLAWGPALALFAFSLVSTPSYSARFLAPGLPLYFLFMGRLLDLAPPLPRRAAAVLFVLWAAVSATMTVARNWGPSTPRRAAEHLAQRIRPGDRIVVTERASYSVYWEWAVRLRREETLGFLGEPAVAWAIAGQHLTPSSELSLESARRVWLVHTPFDGPQAGSAAAAVGQYGFQPFQSFPDLSLRLLER